MLQITRASARSNGLKGTYDFTLQWTDIGLGGGPLPAARIRPARMTPGTSIFTAAGSARPQTRINEGPCGYDCYRHIEKPRKLGTIELFYFGDSKSTFRLTSFRYHYNAHFVTLTFLIRRMRAGFRSSYTGWNISDPRISINEGIGTSVRPGN
jgi:hypothetical protein